MTAWDLVIDPILSGPNVRAWAWEQGGPYFDIPARNYVGWMMTTVTVYLLYRLYEWRVPSVAARAVSHAAAGLPLVAYAAMMCSDLLVGGPPALVVIAPFAMGVPLLIAAERWWRYRAAAS